MDSLKEALKAADEEVSHQKSLNTQLELEVRSAKKFNQLSTIEKEAGFQPHFTLIPLSTKTPTLNVRYHF